MDRLDEAEILGEAVEIGARRIPWIRRARTAVAAFVAVLLALRWPIAVAAFVAVALAFVAAGRYWGTHDLLPALQHFLP